MTELRQQLFDILQSYAPPDVKRSQIEEAKVLRDLPMDSIALLGAFDEIEEQFGIKFTGAVSPDMPLDEFEAMVEKLIAAKNA
jgi:acyl carrier protein